MVLRLVVTVAGAAFIVFIYGYYTAQNPVHARADDSGSQGSTFMEKTMAYFKGDNLTSSGR